MVMNRPFSDTAFRGSNAGMLRPRKDKPMNSKIKEFRERVRLTREGVANVTSVQFSDEAWEDVKKALEAQLNKVLNDPDLALIDREKKCKYKLDIPDSRFTGRRPSYIFAMGQTRRNNDMRKAGFTHSIIPLKEELKEMPRS